MKSTQSESIDIWERWDWLWSVLFYGSIAITLLIASFDPELPAGVRSLLLPVSAGWALWHWLGLGFAYRGDADWEDRIGVRFLVILGDIAFWVILITLSPTFYFSLFGFFGQLFRHLPMRLAAVATFFLVGGFIYRQFAEDGQPISLADYRFWIYFFIGAVGILLGVWISAIIQQSTRRRELIKQLEVAQAELAAAERREGVLQERQRLARDIHDTLAQGFTSIVMHLEAAEQAFNSDPDTGWRHLNQARRTARHSLEQARRVVQDLRPDLLEKQSLTGALQRTAGRWTEETGIPSRFTITGSEIPLHPEIEVTLLRGAQEALANVRKHAGAASVSLTLSYMGDLITLDVQDDGGGFQKAPETFLSGGYGLQAMRERVALLGGEVMVESEAGEGTTVAISIPSSHLEPMTGNKVAGADHPRQEG